jgi:phosphatidylethanolamine-binding protein (PEBP) family uncharacterized protein
VCHRRHRPSPWSSTTRTFPGYLLSLGAARHRHGITSLPEASTPAGATQATNSAGKAAAYFGPCPPSGTHHYQFTVSALSSATGLPDGANLDRALQAIDASAIARGRLVGTYAR